MKFKSETMTLNLGDVPFLTYNRLSEIKCIRHAFSTRLGGVSEGDFKSMNLSFGRGDSDSNVTENYKRICSAVGFEYESLTASKQIHETVVRKVTADNRGVGIYKPMDMPSVDALVTNDKDVTLVTYYADCTPVFFVDSVKKAIGLAHAGWRGTVGEISRKVTEKMCSEYGTDPADLICAVGPVIGKCCYEVSSDCADQFVKVFGTDSPVILKTSESDKFMIDLALANKILLLKSGVKEENIVLSDLCTQCNSDLLWSHRATAGKRGTMAAFMSLI